MNALKGISNNLWEGVDSSYGHVVKFQKWVRQNPERTKDLVEQFQQICFENQEEN